MWNNPLIGDYHLFSAADLQLTRLAAILGHTATVEWITILACLRVLEKGSWKALNAFAVLHAWGIAIQMTAGAMHHLCTDCVEQLWIKFLVWEFGRNDGVNAIRVKFLLEPDQGMRVRQTSLLPLYGIHPTGDVSKDLTFLDKPE